jgi:hypothetical protein
MDGRPASGKTVARKRAVLHNALEYAAERQLINRNRLPEIKWTAPRESKSTDKRIVINPKQAVALSLARHGRTRGIGGIGVSSSSGQGERYAPCRVHRR